MNLRHPSVLAAMAGRNDGEFCKRIGDLGVGMVTIGGVSVDEKTMEASRKMAERGRQEFLFRNLYSFLEENIKRAQVSKALVCVNIRSASLEGYTKASEIICDLKGVVEINAHCRQKEITEIGAGQSLLYDLEKFKFIVSSLKEVGVNPVVKFRGNVRPERDILRTVQPDFVHIDAYKEGKKGIDFTVFEKIKDIDCFKIGNNSIKTTEVALKVLKICDAFSFSRIAEDTKAVKNLVNLV